METKQTLKTADIDADSGQTNTIHVVTKILAAEPMNWFEMVELQFPVGEVKSEQTMFVKVVTGMNEDIINNIYHPKPKTN